MAVSCCRSLRDRTRRVRRRRLADLAANVSRPGKRLAQTGRRELWSAVVVYQHPLAFLLGLEGVALLRAHAGDGFDREFVHARIAEIRALLDRAAPTLGGGLELGELSAADGYRRWSAAYPG